MAQVTTISTRLTAAPTPATGWILTYRKSGKTRRFASLEAARRVHVRAAARYGTRWLSLRPEAPRN